MKLNDEEHKLLQVAALRCQFLMMWSKVNTVKGIWEKAMFIDP